MTKYFFLALTILAFKLGLSQYKPLPMSNTYWINNGGIAMLSCPEDCIPVSYKNYTDSDTLINSIVYVKIKKIENPPINDVSQYPAYTGVIRQDTLNRKIFIILTDSTTEKILYDFSLEVGDTINSVLQEMAVNEVGYFIQTVQSIDSILIQGNYHRRFNINSGYNLSYIEGVGSTYGLIFPYFLGVKESHLQCVNINNASYYPNSNTFCDLTSSVEEKKAGINISISPNPAQKTISIELDASTVIESFEIFNTIGQKLSTIIPKNSSLHLNKLEIDISDLPCGFYSYRMQSNKYVTTTGKFIKE